jgi:type II secretory pathway pseudopilin PulG
VTLVELTIVLVMLAILSYVVLRFLQPRDALALQQAERLRNDLQQVQMLALTWGQSLQVDAAAASYSVSCASAGAAPCNVSPVVNPADGRPFQVTLETGLTLGGPAALQFDPLGRPRLAGTLASSVQTYTISGASAPRSVTVTPLTGLARAQ